VRRSLLSSSANTRELGGIPANGGDLTKNGVFWRSDVPVEPSEEDVETLLSNRMTTIIDLRTEAEAEKSPTPLRKGRSSGIFTSP